jgi:glycosyltransferase involved in cell wall biosynthesis
MDPVNRYTVLVKPGHLEELKVRSDNMVFTPIPAAGASAVKRTVWEQMVLPGLLKAWHADAVYTANNVGIMRCEVPVVIAVRNLEPFFFHEYADGRGPRLRNRALHWLTLHSVRKAARVVVVSEYTRDVVSEECNGCGDKMRVIYHGRPRIAPDEEAASRVKAHLGLGGEYFLTNSKFVPYSNLHNLIEGYASAARGFPGLPRLVLAGGDASPCYKEKVRETIRRNNLGGKVLLAGLIPYASNLALMRGAKLFLFATRLEACPNTLIEAMAMQVPVACSGTPPMPEIAGNGVHYFDPLDPSDISRTILEMYAMSPEDARALVAVASQRAALYSWEETARRVTAVLKEAALER